MKKRIRLTIIAVVVALLAAAWTWRYVTMNKYYDDLDRSDYKLYQAGELVPFEDDGNDLHTDLNGYYIRVDGYEVQDYDEYLAASGLELEAEYAPDKLGLVHITLVNETCEDSGIVLTDFKLRGLDCVMQMDWDVLAVQNNGSTGVKLLPGTECQLVLPYGLSEDSFSGNTWRNIEDYEVYLQITSCLTRKEIQVNG